MYLTPEEYCQRFRINQASIYPALRAGKVPGAVRPMGRLYRIWVDDVTLPEAIKTA